LKPYKSPELLYTAGPERDLIRAGWYAREGRRRLAELCIKAARQGFDDLTSTAAFRNAGNPGKTKKRRESR